MLAMGQNLYYNMFLFFSLENTSEFVNNRRGYMVVKGTCCGHLVPSFPLEGSQSFEKKNL